MTSRVLGRNCCRGRVASERNSARELDRYAITCPPNHPVDKSVDKMLKIGHNGPIRDLLRP
jgi:hypothetical protein